MPSLTLEKTAFTVVKHKPLIKLQDDEQHLMIAEADEKDELNTPLYPKKGRGLKLLSI